MTRIGFERSPHPGGRSRRRIEPVESSLRRAIAIARSVTHPSEISTLNL
ncbi:hypothetical protein [Oxynema aestuarii]|nr:hypothetical protein [Oxynema aestuarii]